MGDFEQGYRYLTPSRVEVTDGRTAMLLSTSGGRSIERTEAHPYFFDGFLGHPEQAATALLLVARVARTRYYVPPGTVAAQIRSADPVVTSNGDRIRFESFSACCGVYARYDLLPGSLDIPPLTSGTTNVDFNPAMRDALAGVGDREPLHLQVGQGGDVTVTTLDARVVERRVDLPERWLKGFAEVQVAAAAMHLVADIPAAEARRFLRSLPPSVRGPLWAVPTGRTLRLVSRPSAPAVCLAGPERLRALEPMIRFGSSLRVYGPSIDATSPHAASSWELNCDAARLVVSLSPEVARGFSGEGGVLADLADDTASNDADLLAPLLGWEPRIDLGRLTAASGLDRSRIVRALGRLGAAGRVGFDQAEGSYFHRELPYDRSALDGMHPRLREARALVEDGAVELVEDGALVRSGDTAHRVTSSGEGSRCTCPWWGRHHGSRGPCKHVLAANIAVRSVAPPGRPADAASAVDLDALDES